MKNLFLRKDHGKEVFEPAELLLGDIMIFMRNGHGELVSFARQTKPIYFGSVRKDDKRIVEQELSESARQDIAMLVAIVAGFNGAKVLQSDLEKSIFLFV